MLAAERRFRILEILAAQRSVSGSDLMEELGATSATIRRDLASLEKEGVLVRSHGGAVSRTSSTNFQPSYEALQRSNRAEKLAIAAAAQKMIFDGDTVFLESSTTVFELSRRMGSFNRLTVATNSPPIVCQLQRWAGVMGITAIDSQYGHTCATQAEAQVKRMLVKAGKQRIGMVDHSKFGRQAFVHIGPITDFTTIITDSGTDPAQIAAMRDAGIEVVVVDVDKHAAE
jgi:DeoR/GlpR family transcriptional regulator of sugar metabolism